MGAYNMEDLTLWQLRYLCQNCDCWKCGFGVTVPADCEYTFEDTRECTIRRPRDWPVYFDDRTVRLVDLEIWCWKRARDLYVDPCLFDNCYKCGLKLRYIWYDIMNHSIPIPWRVMLWDERERMEKLKEGPK